MKTKPKQTNQPTNNKTKKQKQNNNNNKIIHHSMTKAQSVLEKK